MKIKFCGTMRTISMLMIFSLAAGPTVLADEAQLMDMIGQMQKQMAELQSVVLAQKSEIQALKTQGVGIQIAPQGVETPKIDEATFKEQFDKNLTKKIGSADKWLNGLKFKGDIRMRMELRDRSSGSGTSATDDDNEERNRFRFRLRYGFEKIFNEQFKAGFMMASGNDNNPTSTNQTFEDAFSKKAIWIDKVYGTYTPKWALVGPMKSVEVTVGKFTNPFAESSSWITWDSDVNPEGLYEKFRIKLLKTCALDTDLDLLAAQLVVDENENGSHTDHELYAFRAGLVNKFNSSLLEKPVGINSYVTYYVANDYVNDVTGYNLQNYRASAGDPRILQFYNEVSFQMDPLPKTKLFADILKNVDSNNSGTEATNKGDLNLGWVLGAKVGSAKKKGQWEIGYSYAYLDDNSFFSTWADSDFGHTGRRGSVIKAGYGLTDYLTLNGAAFFTDWVDNAARGTRDDKLFQVDLAWKF